MGNALRGRGDRAKTLSDFVSKLRALGYNSKDPDYDHKMATTYAAVVKYKAGCGFR